MVVYINSYRKYNIPVVKYSNIRICICHIIYYVNYLIFNITDTSTLE